MISDSSESCLSCIKEDETVKKLNAIKLYIEKPHLVNKKISGAELEWAGIGGVCLSKKILTDLKSSLHNSNEANLSCTIKVLINYGFESLDSKKAEYPWHKTQPPAESYQLALVRSIIPKNISSEHSIFEVVVIDLCCNNVIFISEVDKKSPRVLPDFVYIISFSDDKLQLETFTNNNQGDPGYRWLQDRLLPTLDKWANQMLNTHFECSPSSLRLIKLHEYNEIYQELKRKYGKFLQGIWKETTDPLKFIYEDIAIAAYLIVLWKQERKEKHLKEKQSFIDLGCGNGLLVYLLSSEGYSGMGIDIRRRKLWDEFPDHVCLKEEVIIPSDKHLYPNFDWLIGNHSDELTPWLPVIAAKSSMTTRFFVIPCCAYDFQSKFQRKKSGISQYAEYLDYIKDVGNICQFEMWKDKLRIPSTKRTCFIGQNRKYSFTDWNEVINQINNFLITKCSRETVDIKNEQTSTDESESDKKWCQGFKAKSPIQEVRNCTQMKTEIREKIVNEIAFRLLSESNIIKVKRDDEWIEWNRGGRLSLKDLANILDSKMKHLKNECGGLQTLLRNHKFIFEIGSGFIFLRVPESMETRKVSPELLKTKKCWFYLHHPQGCVLKSKHCTYLH